MDRLGVYLPFRAKSKVRLGYLFHGFRGCISTAVGPFESPGRRSFSRYGSNNRKDTRKRLEKGFGPFSIYFYPISNRL